MTPKQIELVQSTWQAVIPIKDRAAKLFYGRLFELDPSLKPLFKGEMTEQGRKLTAMINTAVNGLTQLDRIVPAVQDLGRHHVVYGVTSAHYDTAGVALLWTLGKGLGDAFTPPVAKAWATVYGVLASTMKEAASATV